MWQALLIAFGVFMLWEAGTDWEAAYTRTFEMLAGLLLIITGMQQVFDAFRRP
jgi:hypothetical protein